MWFMARFPLKQQLIYPQSKSRNKFDQILYAVFEPITFFWNPVYSFEMQENDFILLMFFCTTTFEKAVIGKMADLPVGGLLLWVRFLSILNSKRQMLNWKSYAMFIFYVNTRSLIRAKISLPRLFIFVLTFGHLSTSTLGVFVCKYRNRTLKQKKYSG